jgi:zinc and cadmium transporter
MSLILWSLGATFLVSLISLIGVFTLPIKKDVLAKGLLWLVGFSAGGLMGGAFLHLLPELIKEGGKIEEKFLFVLVGFSLFFILEKFLHWHHCHKSGGECSVKTLSYMNLIGDGLHNFIDGLVIAASFAVDIRLGLTTTVAMIFHEIPQEISDFAVLIYGGFSRAKALLFNFLSALVAILGAVVGIFLSQNIKSATGFLVALTIGGFVYIAASDLIPELHRQPKLKNSLISFLFFILGIGFMYSLRFFAE